MIDALITSGAMLVSIVTVLVPRSILAIASGSTSFIALSTEPTQWPHVISGTSNFISKRCCAGTLTEI